MIGGPLRIGKDTYNHSRIGSQFSNNASTVKDTLPRHLS